MSVLGIYPSHDSGAAIIDSDGQILAAINEGRLIGEKLYWGFPEQSIKKALEISECKPEDVERIAIAGRNPAIGKREAFDKVGGKKRLMEYLSYLPFTGSKRFSDVGREMFSYLRNDDKTRDRLEEIGLEAPVEFYDHHLCHAASAYYTSPFDEDSLVVTIDAQGDFRSAGVYVVNENGMLEQCSWTSFYHSLGKYWSYVTYNLGFTPMRHEGKISGLAAHGDPEVCIDTFRKFIQVDTDSLQLRSGASCWNNPAASRLHSKLQGVGREDIAAALQQRTEEVVTELVDAAMEKYNRSTLALAGGVFANVGLNQELLKLDSVDDIFIHPNMGDGGLGVGAAYLDWANRKNSRGENPKPTYIENVYLGTEKSNSEIESALEDAGLEYETPKDPAERIGNLIAEGYVVGRYEGRLEYGPRALGNRSILALPTDPTCQEWLNERLDRTEFMPFAPSILERAVDDYFEDPSSGLFAGRFMTITFDVTKKGQQIAPGVVHVDNTARPQIVNKENNPSYHSVIETVYEQTGIPLIINTSFNAHGQPIVNEPDQAIQAYKDGIIDVLSIGDFVVTKEKEPPIKTDSNLPTN